MLRQRAKHKIKIKKHHNGKIYECNHANVQSKIIYIYCPEIPLEEEDLIIHKINDDNIQEFIVMDRGYHDQVLEPHYQAKVMRKKEYEKLKEEKNSFNINSNNSQININSNSNSFNSNNNFNYIPFNEIREMLNGITDKSVKNEALLYLENMENSEDEKIFEMNYSKFISKIADYITILTPIVTLISKYI